MIKLVMGLLVAVTMVTGLLTTAVAVYPGQATGLWNSGNPTTQDYVDGRPINLGTKFRANEPGVVTGIKFYKGPRNTGVHTGALWSSTGERLASVTFKDETASGWQVAPLATPVTLTAGQTYTVSYWSPRGIFARDAQYFSERTISSTDGALSTVAGNTGAFRYASGNAFPIASRGDANYWVDVVFQPKAGGKPTPGPGPITPPAPAPPVQNAVCPSDGYGGAMTDSLNRTFTAPNGASSQFHVYAGGIDQSKPIGIIVQLHGDGAYEFGRPTSGKLLAMSKVAKEQNMILVSVKSPDRVGSVTWWENPKVNVPFLQSLLDTEVYGKYAIDKNKVWLSGYSGGAEFISLYYTKQQHQTFCGGGALISGGGSATAASPTVPFPDNFKNNFRMHFYTGQNDGAGSPINWNGYRAAQSGSAHWTQRGFTVTTEFPAGVDHYQLDEPRVLREQLAKAYPLR